MADKETTFNDLVSYNSKYVLWALFILVIIILLVFTITVQINTQLSDRLNTVFIGAISGTLALGGTLITQLWGKKTSKEGPTIPPKKVDEPTTGTRTGGKVDEPTTGTRTGKKVDEPTIGKKVDEPTIGGKVDEPTIGGKVDEPSSSSRTDPWRK